MAGIKFDLEGLKETADNLDRTKRKVNRSANEALKAGAEVFKTNLEGNTPTEKVPKHGSHAKDSIVTSNVSTKQDGYKSIKAGYDANHFWYMWFLERGTKQHGKQRIQPRHIVENTLKNSKETIQKAIADILMDGVNE